MPGVMWTEGEVAVMLSIYYQPEIQLAKGRLSKRFSTHRIISDRLRDAGFHRSPLQVNVKLRALLGPDHNKKSPEDCMREGELPSYSIFYRPGHNIVCKTARMDTLQHEQFTDEARRKYDSQQDSLPAAKKPRRMSPIRDMPLMVDAPRTGSDKNQPHIAVQMETSSASILKPASMTVGRPYQTLDSIRLALRYRSSGAVMTPDCHTVPSSDISYRWSTGVANSEDRVPQCPQKSPLQVGEDHIRVPQITVYATPAPSNISTDLTRLQRSSRTLDDHIGIKRTAPNQNQDPAPTVDQLKTGLQPTGPASEPLTDVVQTPPSDAAAPPSPAQNASVFRPWTDHGHEYSAVPPEHIHIPSQPPTWQYLGEVATEMETLIL